MTRATPAHVSAPCSIGCFAHLDAERTFTLSWNNMLDTQKGRGPVDDRAAGAD